MSLVRLIVVEAEEEKVLDYPKTSSTFSFTQEDENLLTVSYFPKLEDKRTFYDFYQNIKLDEVINVKYNYIDDEGIETVLFDAKSLIDFNNIRISFVDGFRNLDSILNELKINFIFN